MIKICLNVIIEIALAISFLVSFKETLQYCDEWGKFTSGGGANFKRVTRFALMLLLQCFN